MLHQDLFSRKPYVVEGIGDDAENVSEREKIDGKGESGKSLRIQKLCLTNRIVKKGEDGDPVILGPHRETFLNFFEGCFGGKNSSFFWIQNA